ncbi:MAG TPA: response regulator [Stellaceae bacterium]|nr:response regulator [Stellaceae bacterium]
MKKRARARLVVIEDSSEYLDYLATLTERAGYAVATFTAAAAALQYIEHNPVGLVVTDVFMPEMDGFEVLREIRGRFPKLPIVAISGGGLSMPMCLKAMERLGARATFVKPVDADALIACIARLTGTLN